MLKPETMNTALSYMSGYGSWCSNSAAGRGVAERRVEIRPVGFAAAGSVQTVSGLDLDLDLNGHITPKTCGGMT
jgi:hypothetical protein